jgi:hypothetical protein
MVIPRLIVVFQGSYAADFQHLLVPRSGMRVYFQKGQVLMKR